MNPRQKHPFFIAALVTAGIALPAETWCLHSAFAAAQAARRGLDLARRELRAVTGLTPAATADNARLIEDELADVLSRLAVREAELADAEMLADEREGDPAPAQRSGAFFDIAAFVERMRELAERNGVQFRPDERFSFGAYANEAPELGMIPAVFEERVIVQHLLESLFAAHPRELLSVQRERARRPTATTAGPRGPVTPGRPAGPGVADEFELDPRISMRVPGVVETKAFRFSFTGHTAVLREWLNQLADSGLPALVRLVEVAPGETSAGGLAPGMPPVPLISRRDSRFTVTIEWVKGGNWEANGT